MKKAQKVFMNLSLFCFCGIAVYCMCGCEKNIECVDYNDMYLILYNDDIAISQETEQIYTSDDVYIFSFNSGYISQKNRPGDKILVIESESQLSYAEERYGLAVSDGLPNENDSSIADAFQQMKEKYPINEFSYAVCYDCVPTTGYYLHADKLAINGDLLYFKMDNDSHYSQQVEGCVVDGFCHMAAVPKDLFAGKCFTNVIYPDHNDIEQDRLYTLYN